MSNGERFLTHAVAPVCDTDERTSSVLLTKEPLLECFKDPLVSISCFFKSYLNC